MSVFHKTMVWLGLVDDDEYYADEDEFYADEYGEPVAVAPRQATRVAAATATTPSSPVEMSPLTVIRTPRKREDAPEPPPPAPSRPTVKPVPMPTNRAHVMDPTGFNDAQEVGDRLKAGQPVILNLQSVDRELQRRLIDFSSGLAYALSGTMSKVADHVFLLTPSNVELADAEMERLQARGLYRAPRS